jgi:hypothetical protein
MHDEMIGNDRLDQGLEDEKEEVGGIEMNPRENIENERLILTGSVVRSSAPKL